MKLSIYPRANFVPTSKEPFRIVVPYHGKLCNKCGIFKCLKSFCTKKRAKYGVSAVCKICMNEISRVNYVKNKQKVNTRNNNNYLIKKEIYLKRMKQYALLNRSKRNANARKNSKLNRPKENARWMMRKAHERNCRKLFPLDYPKVLSIYEEAHALTKSTGIPHEVDHIIPLKSKVVCGLHVSWNMQILTKSENSKKGNKIL